MWKYKVPCDLVLYDAAEQVNSVKLLNVRWVHHRIAEKSLT